VKKKQQATLEERYMAVINFCEKHPYSLEPSQLAKKFRLRRETIYWLSNLLLLEIIGRKDKNERREVEIFIEENPNLRAIDVARLTGKTLHVVYDAAAAIGHRFQTKYTQRRMLKQKLEALNQH
jgi:hypothetical protein